MNIKSIFSWEKIKLTFKIDRRSFIILTLTILGFLFFQEFFVNIFNKYFVAEDKVFNTVESLPRNDIVIGIIGVFLLQVYLFIIPSRRKKVLTFKSLLSLLSIPCFYLCCRLTGKYWIFTSFSTFHNLFYADILLFWGSLEIIVFFTGLTYRKAKFDFKNGFIYDEPLSKNDSDSCEREHFAKELCCRIENTNSEKTSFAIGIHGEWGSGKTSFLNLIKRNLNLRYFHIIEFNPWLSSSSSSIIIDFLNTLRKELGKYHSGLANDIENYTDSLSKVDDSMVSKFVNSVLSFGKRKSTPSDEYLKINEAIQTLSKRILIIIDDIDRLDKEEVVEVIKLIRNTANFGNTVFIASYDKNYVNSAIQHANAYKPESFLEKIFNLEIPLPGYGKEVLQIELKNLIFSSLIEEDQQEFNDIFIKPNKKSFDIDFTRFIGSIRDVKRFSNLFLLTYGKLKEETVFEDLVYLEFIKYKYPQVYDRFYWNARDYLKRVIFKSDHYSLIQKSEINYKDSFDRYLDRNKAVLLLTPYEIEEIIRVYNYLFPSERKLHQNKRKEYLSIYDPEGFERYFFLKLDLGKISENEFKTYISNSFEVFKAKIKEWIDKGYRKKLFERIKYYTVFINQEEFENIVRAVFFASNIPRIVDADYPYYAQTDLFNILNYKNNYEIGFGSIENYHRFLIEILNETSITNQYQLVFIKHIIEIRNKNSDGYKDNLPSNDILNAIVLEKFNNEVKVQTTFSQDLWNFFINCNFDPESGGLEKKNNTEIVRIMKDFVLNKDRKGFLKQTIFIHQAEKKEDTLYQLNLVPQVFEEFDTFLEEIEKWDDIEPAFVNEYIQFYKECKRTGYNQPIKYSFTEKFINEIKV